MGVKTALEESLFVSLTSITQVPKSTNPTTCFDEEKEINLSHQYQVTHLNTVKMN